MNNYLNINFCILTSSNFSKKFEKINKIWTFSLTFPTIEYSDASRNLLFIV